MTAPDDLLTPSEEFSQVKKYLNKTILLGLLTTNLNSLFK